MTRAPWVLPKPGPRLPRGQHDRRVDDARLAAGQRPDAGGVDRVASASATSSSPRRPGSPASGRTRSPPARTGSPRRPGPTASTTTSSSPVAGRRAGARREHPGRHHRRSGSPGCGRRSGPTAPSPPATPRRSATVPAPLVLGTAAAADRLGAAPLARIAGRGAIGARPEPLRSGPGRGGGGGAAPGRDRLGGRRRGRAQRGVRRPVAGLR